MINNSYNKSRFRILKGGKIALVISIFIVSTTLSYATPSGENIINGGIVIDRNTANTTNINQSTNTGIINWQNFDVNTNEIVNFNMPNSSSSILNRVTSNNPSNIYGQINSNGQVFLVNQNGIYFGENSQVNTAGFTASTLDITNENFLNSKYIFEGTSNSSILNLGTITTNNAYTALLAKDVINEGVIKARLGNVQLASGEKITLDINGNSLVKLTIDKGTLDSLVQNKGLIQADGGIVYLTTKALDTVLNGVVNNTGVIEANSVKEKNGKIILFAHGGTANIAGTLEAKDGFVETSGKELHVEASTKVNAGTWLLDPTNLVVESTGGSTLTGSSVSATAIQNALSSTDVELQADEDITVNEDITWSDATKLTLTAGDEAYVNATIENTNSTTGGVYFNAANTTDKVIFGTDGKVIVNNVFQLQWINQALNGKYELGSNIDALTTHNWDSGKGWIPLGNDVITFTGIFDGKGYTISSLLIDREKEAPIDTGYLGLFGYTSSSSTISNLGLIDSYIKGYIFVGGLVGENHGTITNSYSTSNYGSVIFGISNIGGLVGFNMGTISNSYAYGYVTSFGNNCNKLGGLVGQNWGTIINSYSGGVVNGTTDIGGLVGENHRTITNSYSTTHVSAPEGATPSGSYYAGGGGLVGSSSGYDARVVNSYWDTQTSGQAISAGGTGLTTAQMKDTKIFYDAGWDFDTIWGRDTNNIENDGYLGLRGLSNFDFNTVVALTVADQSKIYDATSDVVATFDKADIVDTIGFGTKNVGSQTFTSVIGDYALSYATGYDSSNTEILVYNSGATNITKKALDFLANNKVYDGTTDAITTLSGVISGDLVTSSSSASFDTKNVGTAKTVTLDSVTLSGTDIDNYSVALGQITTADITKKALTISDITASDKEYDGTTDATTTATLDGIVSGDAVSNSITSTFDNKNAGTAKIVTIDTMTLSGTDSTNYSIATGQTTTADITQKALDFLTNNKVYDGTTDAITTLSGVISGDLVTSSSSASFDNKNVGTAKTVTITSGTLGGTDSANYSIATGQTTTADITKKALDFLANNKVYDGTTDAITTLSGVIAGDIVTSSSSALFDNKNAGTAKTVTITGGTLGGTDSANYSISSGQTATADITQKALTISSITASDKEYDGTTDATTTATTLNGIINSEDVSINDIASTFDNKNAGTAKTVTITSGTLVGTDSANYSIAIGQISTADITKKALTISDITASDKEYDGTTDATTTATLVGTIGGDTVSNSITSTFDNKNAGTAKIVTIDTMTLSGTDSTNYSIATGQTTTADITQKALDFLANNKVYDGTTDAITTLSGVISGDLVTSSSSASFDTKNVGTAKTVTLDSVTLSGTDIDNYSVALGQITTADITKKALTISDITASDKEYDGTTIATTTATLTGLVAGDSVLIASTFDNKNVGVGKTVTLNSLSGLDGNNYSATLGQTTTADITAIPTPIPDSTPVTNKYKNILNNILRETSNNNKQIKEIFIRENNLIVVLEDDKRLRVSQEQLKDNLVDINDIKLALLPNRIIRLFNGGLHLPDGLSQDSYMLEEEK